VDVVNLATKLLNLIAKGTHYCGVVLHASFSTGMASVTRS